MIVQDISSDQAAAATFQVHERGKRARLMSTRRDASAERRRRMVRAASCPVCSSVRSFISPIAVSTA